jgi:ABC-type sulfate transport system substrate-binding protein
VKQFVLLRGKDSGMLYLYDRETWEYMMDSNTINYGFILEFVLDHDDPETLKQMQALVNKDIQVKD